MFMSNATRTSPKEKSCFGEGFGLAHEVDHSLRSERVKPYMLKRLTNKSDPLIKQVGALLRGEPIDQTIRIGDLVSRELAFLERFGLPKLTEEELTTGYERMVSAYGAVTIHDRFIPGDLLLAGIMPVVYKYNDQAEAAGEPTLKLGHTRDEEWWRKDKQAQHIRTNACIFRAALGRLMEPTDLAGRPFKLKAAEQDQWAREQGGTGVTTAEKAAYLAIRSVTERNLPPWGSGAFLRCANAYGPENRLTVYWLAGYGFDVDYASLDEYWNGGALPEKSVDLGA
jgi:hypothetical protein